MDEWFFNGWDFLITEKLIKWIAIKVPNYTKKNYRDCWKIRSMKPVKINVKLQEIQNQNLLQSYLKKWKEKKLYKIRDNWNTYCIKLFGLTNWTFASILFFCHFFPLMYDFRVFKYFGILEKHTKTTGWWKLSWLSLTKCHKF